MSNAPLLSKMQIIARISAVILSAEFLVMMILAEAGLDHNPLVTAALDVLLLALFTTPAIYFWVIQPFVRVRDQALASAEELALTDGLTQLANRRQFDQMLDHEFARHSRSGAEMSLLLIDVDHFKLFNDSYGHVRGDECLRRVAGEIAACIVRSSDVAARFGGEEFVCILPETDADDARMLAEGIRSRIEALAIAHESSPVSAHVTVSIGACTGLCTQAFRSVDLVHLADQMLYQAKSNGRNRVECARSPIGVTHEPRVFRLVWKDAYCSGHPLIDAQHRQLFRRSDDLLDAVLAERPHSEILQKINALLDDMIRHFDDELRILTELAYPGSEAHGIEHAALIAKAGNLVQQLDLGTLQVGEVFQLLAMDVITHHILHSDRDYFPLTRAMHEAGAA